MLAIMVAAAGVRVATRPAQPLDAHPMARCSPIVTATGRTFFVDPVNGSNDGDGTAQRPWRDLGFLVDSGKLGEHQRELRWLDRAIAALMHDVPTVRLRKRRGAVVHAGDTVLLASGNYGAVDLANLVNGGFVTLAAAPGAAVRFAGLNMAGASHFVLQGIAITGMAQPGESLVSTHRAGPRRADNIVFDRIAVSSALPIAVTAPQVFADQAPHGVMLGGDCLTLRRSELHDLESAVNIYRGRNVTLANNRIYNFAVDGVQFSGQYISIRDNRIFDQWPTPDPLHPDCIQGQPPDDQMFGPVAISGNLCVRSFARPSGDTTATRRIDRFGWQGINIFNGRWRAVTVRCNIVLPAAQHGIALYGVEQGLIEGNTVAGFTGARPSWIAAMPSGEGRQPRDVVIRENRATAYLNAVHDAPQPIDAMIDLIKVDRRDTVLTTALRRPIIGVALERNTWLAAGDKPVTFPPDDPRFATVQLATLVVPRDESEARRAYSPGSSCAQDAAPHASPADHGPRRAGQL